MIHFILGLLISDDEQSTASQVCEITVLNENKSNYIISFVLMPFPPAVNHGRD